MSLLRHWSKDLWGQCTSRIFSNFWYNSGCLPSEPVRKVHHHPSNLRQKKQWSWNIGHLKETAKTSSHFLQWQTYSFWGLQNSSLNLNSRTSTWFNPLAPSSSMSFCGGNSNPKSSPWTGSYTELEEITIWAVLKHPDIKSKIKMWLVKRDFQYMKGSTTQKIIQPTSFI